MEDAQYGIASDAKRRAENFVRAYYKTINKICEAALGGATERKGYFAHTELDLTTGDDIPLFSSMHNWGSANTAKSGIQSNYFWGDIFSYGDERLPSTSVFEESLTELTVKLRNMKDENGEPLGYEADTLILPGNMPQVEMIARKVCGTPGALGGNYNDINLHYGKWNIVVLPTWQPTRKSVMVMSSEANKNLSGNMFFNRVPLTVSNWVDHHTGNYIWNGRCRFGVGFGTYKHILLAVDSATPLGECEQL